MKTLSEALPTIEATLKEAENTQNTPLLGSIQNVGKSSIEALMEKNRLAMELQRPLQSQNGQVQQSKSLRKIGHRDAGKIANFTEALSQACIVLKQYGKTPDELRILRDGLLMFLDDFDVDDIMAALKVYVKRNNDIPTPKDLRDILVPPPAKPNWPTYVALRKKIKDDIYVTEEQREYIRYCDNWAINYALGEKEDYMEAKAIVDGYKGNW